MLSEKLLKQVAEEFALAMNESLPKPEQCQHQFSEEFERKMQRLLSAVPINTQIAVVVPKLSYTKPMNCNEGWPIGSAFTLWIHNSRTVKITM